MNEQQNLQVISDLYEAFNCGDIEAVLGMLDPQADLHFEGSIAIPWSGNRKGREGWAAFFQAVGENLDEVTVDMQPFVAQDDRVVAAGRYQGRVKRTDKRIDSPMVHLWTLRGGLIVNCVELTNTAVEAAACTSGAGA